MTDRGYPEWADRTESRILHLTRTTLRSVWPTEPGYFTPWLSTHLDYLESLHLGRLTLKEIEYQVPGTNRWLDILASAEDGQLVAIENQYRRTDHDHLTRGLAYAINAGTRWLVVISEEHLPEFIEVAKYLNEVADNLPSDRAVGLFLVNLSVLTVENLFLPQFEVIVRPSLAMVERATPPATGSAEEFLALLGSDMLKRVVATWEATPGCGVERRSGTAIALTVANRSKPTGKTVMIGIYATGDITLNVGYLWETEAFVDRDQLLSALERRLGPISRTGKAYYCGIVSPDGERIASAGKWAAEALERYARTGEPLDDTGAS